MGFHQVTVQPNKPCKHILRRSGSGPCTRTHLLLAAPREILQEPNWLCMTWMEPSSSTRARRKTLKELMTGCSATHRLCQSSANTTRMVTESSSSQTKKGSHLDMCQPKNSLI